MKTSDLTPELRERLARIAAAEKKLLEQVLNDAVQSYWVAFATRNRTNPGEW